MNIKCNLNNTSTWKRLAKHILISLYAISGHISMNLSMAVQFCRLRFSVVSTARKFMSLQVNALNQSGKATRFVHKGQIESVITDAQSQRPWKKHGLFVYENRPLWNFVKILYSYPETMGKCSSPRTRQYFVSYVDVSSLNYLSLHCRV